MKVSVLTLGCKVNKYESDVLLKAFKERGYEVSDKLEKADAYIINTCAVTNEAERKSRQMISRCKKFNPEAKIYVCGCASQHNPEQFLGKSQLVKGVAGKEKLLDLSCGGMQIDALPENYQSHSYSLQPRLRAYIKVQDGCNNFCSYCIIPYLRGRSRSRQLADILIEVSLLADDVKEIVLTGINLSDFKIDGENGLLKLLQELDGFGKRIRLSSMEECIIDEDFVKQLSQLKNFCPHFHLSLQSGSDSVLRRMNRHYTTKEFLQTCQLIRKYFPLAGITTDVIVGFSGESEEEFLQTEDFIKQVQFSGLHIFPYSHREGTVASRLADLPGTIKKQRAMRLKILDGKLRKMFIEKNSTGRVLIEEKEGEFYVGFTENYIKCYFTDQAEVGQIVSAKILSPFKEGALAEKLQENA